MFCNNCGAEIPDGGKFCTKCGNKIEAQPAADVKQENIQPMTAENTEPAVDTVEDNVAADAGNIESESTQAQSGQYEMPQGVTNPYGMPQGGANPYGMPQGGANPYGMPQEAAPAKEKKPVNKKLIIIIAAAVVALIIIVAAVLIVFNVIKKKKEIEAKTIDFKEKYLSVTFEGYDTYGTVEVSIDSVEFMEEALTAMGYDEEDDSTKAAKDLKKLIMAVDIEVSEKNNLSNGQEITIDIIPDQEDMDELDVIFDEVQFTVKVEGLEDVIAINPFDNLTVTTSGFDGSVDVDWEYTGDDGYLDDYSFSCDNRWYLSIGDSYTIYIDDYESEYLLEYYGVKLTETEKTFTVENADHYITKYDDINEEMLNTIKKMTANKLVDRYDTSYADFELDSYEYYGMYVMEGLEDSYSYDNMLCVIYKCVIKSKDGSFDPVTVFVPVICYYLEEKVDGTQEIDDSAYVDLNFTYISEDSYDYVYGYLTEKEVFDEYYDPEEYNYDFGGSVKDFSKETSDDEDTTEENPTEENLTDEDETSSVEDETKDSTEE